MQTEKAEHSPDRCLRCSFLVKKKKCQRQLFLSSVVELLQELFSNLFSVPLKETCCAGGRWGGCGEPWLGTGWPDPAGSRSWCPSQHFMAANEFTQLPLWEQPQPMVWFGFCSFFPPISAYLLTFTCFQAEGSQFSWPWSCPAQFPSLSPPLPFPCPILPPGNCVERCLNQTVVSPSLICPFLDRKPTCLFLDLVFSSWGCLK